MPWLAVLALPHCCQWDCSQGEAQDRKGAAQSRSHHPGHTHSWNAQRIGTVTSSLAFQTRGRDLNFVYCERWSSLALGWQWEEQADEFPVLTPFSAFPCVPDSTPVAMTNLSYLANLPSLTQGCFQTCCAIAQGMVPLLSVLFWEPKGGCGAPFPFRQSRSFFLELHLPDRALSCAEHSPHHSKQDECFHAFPSLCDSFTNSVSHFHMMNLNRIQEKDPTSWSWTEPHTPEWGRLALYLACSSLYLLKEPGMQDWNLWQPLPLLWNLEGTLKFGRGKMLVFGESWTKKFVLKSVWEIHVL